MAGSQSFDESWVREISAEAKRRGIDLDRDREPEELRGVLNALDVLEAMHQDGHKLALMIAVYECMCCSHDILPPVWVVEAFTVGVEKVWEGEAGSWDEAFGRPYGKGVRTSRIGRVRRERGEVYRAVSEARQRKPDRPLDDGLFEEVGAKFGMGKTRARKLYYQAKKIFDP